MTGPKKQNFYEILDVSFGASSENIRTSYIRAKNAYNRDSLAAYSLFDRDETKEILSEIEEAYSVLSDPERRRKYDESHGIITSESVYDGYHKGNHVVAAFSRETMFDDDNEPFDDPFRRRSEDTSATTSSASTSNSGVNPAVARMNSAEQKQAPILKPLSFQREITVNPEMEEKLKNPAKVDGAFLRSVREYKQISAEEMIDHLKISKNYLAAIEEDDIARLPANVFVRGFVIQYAKMLKLEHEKIATSYMDFLKTRRP